MEKLKADIASTAKKAGMDTELDLVSELSVRVSNIFINFLYMFPINLSSLFNQREPPPIVEWWDVQLTGPDGAYEDFSLESEHTSNAITNLVQHPIPIQPPAELGLPPPKPLMLTKKERKKLRRQRRQEAQKEKRDKIRLGLIPPEQPKVKISNLMRVLGTAAVQDPTQIEAAVRAQMRARVEKHEKYIAENKLTKEQKRERRRLKLIENTHIFIEVAVFRITDLSRPSHRFKVNINASQNNLSGMAFLHPGSNLVVVEGGFRGIKQYKKLMLRRINWTEVADEEVDEDGEDNNNSSAQKEPNRCDLVWEGKIKKRLFQGFKVQQCPTEREIKEILDKAGCVHYWTAAKNLTIE